LGQAKFRNGIGSDLARNLGIYAVNCQAGEFQITVEIDGESHTITSGQAQAERLKQLGVMGDIQKMAQDGSMSVGGVIGLAKKMMGNNEEAKRVAPPANKEKPKAKKIKRGK
jgi:hypothetical protein